MPARFAAFYRRHEGFILVFILFLAFRLMALWLMRPGGFIADASDYDFYADWGAQTARGYVTFQNLWTAYPPLFARLMLPVFALSARVPPWIEPRLSFHLLFGLVLLLFECGNLIVIYRLSGRLAADEGPAHESPVDESPVGESPVDKRGSFAATPGLLAAPLHPVLFYALLFVPVHTLLGWFEAMPLFFLLLALDLLIRPGRWSWLASAVAMALGFLVKLTPIILLPVAIRWLGARLSWEAARSEWFNRKSPGNLLRPALYTLTAGAVIVGLGYLLLGGQTALALSSFRVNSLRPPWQSVWALIDGYWGYGLVPLDMRNLQGLDKTLWVTRIPWTWVSLGFLAIFLWLYTRRYDWNRPRTAIAFTGVAAIWMFLYSKGWSPQFLVWMLAFIALLMPNLRGVALALALSVLNVVEAYIYLILLPGERWILVGTVLLRTLLLVALAVEMLAQIWPRSHQENEASPARPAGSHAQAWVSWILVAATVIFLIAGTPRMAQAYSDRRLAEFPCREAVAFLQAEHQTLDQTVGGMPRIAMTQLDLWRDFYPWLRGDYTLRVIDSYDPNDRPADEVLSERLAAWAGEGEFWWLSSEGGPWATANPAPNSLSFFSQPDVHVIEQKDFGPCELRRVALLAEDEPLATAAVQGGPIELLASTVTTPVVGAPLGVVLYWQAASPVEESYTVFTQLFDADGAMVAQQDNLPVNGLAPTNTWAAGTVIRDPFVLRPKGGLREGSYRLLVGLYDGQGQRAPITQVGGAALDAVTIDVAVP